MDPNQGTPPPEQQPATLEQRVATCEDNARAANTTAETAQAGIAAISNQLAKVTAQVTELTEKGISGVATPNVAAAGDAIGRACQEIGNVTNPSVDAFRALTWATKEMLDALSILIADLGGPVHGAAAAAQANSLADALRPPAPFS